MEAQHITEAHSIDGHQVTAITYNETHMLIMRDSVPTGQGRVLCVNYTDQIETD